jgi:dTDP-glucose pyrophosphorylase
VSTDAIVGVILAAGQGRRLGALGAEYVKALLPVANEPVIVHHLRLLHSLGVRRVLIIVGHHSEQVEAALGSGDRYEMELEFIHQAQPLGSAHALASVRRFVDVPFLLLLGDYYFVAPDAPVMLRHLENGDSCIAVKREPDERLVREACAVGISDDHRVISIVEKPVRPATDLKGCGFYGFTPEVFDAVARTPRTALRDEYELTVSLELFMQSRNRLFAEEIIEWDNNITRPEDLLQCNLEWLARRGMTNLVSTRALVDRQVALDETVIGDRAAVRDGAKLRRVVVFPGADLAGFDVLESALVTRNGLISCPVGDSDVSAANQVPSR